jgi:pilus assembly protein CpaB
LLVVAALGAAGVFIAVANYVSEVRAEVGDKFPVLELTQRVEAFAEIPPDAVEVREVPRLYLPEGALDRSQLQGVVATATLDAGTILQQGMVAPPPDLAPGEREIAITVDAETGVAGKIFRGTFVDIYATFLGDTERPSCVSLIVPRALVLDVGQVGEAVAETEDGAPTQESVIPVTFALGRDEIDRLVFAESFAEEVRLARIGSAASADAVVPGSAEDEASSFSPCEEPEEVFPSSDGVPASGGSE